MKTKVTVKKTLHEREWQVRVHRDGKFCPNETYYTPDKQDAMDTAHMISSEAGEEGFSEEEPPVKVIFRMDPLSKGGECFALFPELEGSRDHCIAFQHLGQHSSADYDGCIRRSRPATPEEYAGLKDELESPPYNYKLQVIQRYTRR